MRSPFSARSCLAKPKSQMRRHSGFPDSSTYRMLLGLRSLCTTWGQRVRVSSPWGRMPGAQVHCQGWESQKMGPERGQKDPESEGEGRGCQGALVLLVLST